MPRALTQFAKSNLNLNPYSTPRNLVGYETHQGVRTYHAYTDGEDQNVDAALGDWASNRRLPLKSQPDPAWSQVRHFAG